MSGIVYSAVARESTILVSAQWCTEDLEVISRTVLPQIPKYNTKTAYALEGFEFLAIVNDGLTYLCGMRPEFGRRLAFQFLEEVRRKFTSGSLSFRAINALEHELDRDFASVLEDLMGKTNKGEGDNLTTLQGQVKEVTGVMRNNIEKVLERGDKIDSLLDKTSDLESSATQFSTSARRVKRHMMCKNVKMWIILIVVILTILTVIILFATKVIPTGGSGGGSPNSSPTITTLKP